MFIHKAGEIPKISNKFLIFQIVMLLVEEAIEHFKHILKGGSSMMMGIEYLRNRTLISLFPHHLQQLQIWYEFLVLFTTQLYVNLLDVLPKRT